MTEALLRLDELTRPLRPECPWDREQDERTIVPHTLEEAYELADAAHRRDDGKLLDELGDVLFQVHFLSLLLEERGAGSLAEVAEHVRQKLIRRHPHIFGETEVANAGEVLRNWDAIKATEAGREPGIFGEVPENLPAALYARKVQRRAASTGFDVDEPPYGAISGQLEVAEAAGDGDDADARFEAMGDLLFAAVNVARKLKVDPELALRSSADRFRARVEAAEGLAEADGARWAELDTSAQISYYAQPRLREEEDCPHCHERHRTRPRPPDPRLPRQSDRRGRARPALRRDRARGGPVRRVDRRVRGDRAARRRHRVPRQGRHAGRRARQRRDRAGGRRPGRHRPGGARPPADRARRHAEQVAAGRQRDPRRLAGGGARGGRRGVLAAVALPRPRGRARPAGADDERAQRRRARRQLGGLPGVHDRAGRRAVVPRGPALRRRGL